MIYDILYITYIYIYNIIYYILFITYIYNIIYYILFILYYILFIIYYILYILFIIYYILFIIYYILYIIYYILFIIYIYLLYIIYCIYCNRIGGSSSNYHLGLVCMPSTCRHRIPMMGEMTIPHIPNMYITCDLPAAMLIPKSPWLFQC